jgi:hypothetical protein
MTRRRSLDPGQLGFSFDAPTPATRPADLAGLDRMVSAAVGFALKEDRRSRAEVAGAVSSLLDEDVSRWMLDAYSSEARDSHNISAGRFFALIAATKRYDLLNAILRRIGASVLVGEEIRTARIGDLQVQLRAIQEELKKLKRTAPPISGRD